MMPSNATRCTPRRAECLHPHLKCNHCHAPASQGVQLKFCSKCRSALYCSRECQVGDWKKHKGVCTMNTAQVEQLVYFDHFRQVVGLPSPNPGGISMVELDQKLEEWSRVHNHPISMSTIHGLELPVRGHFSRARTHILRFKVSFNENHGGNVGKYFNLDAVQVISTAEARMLNDAWKQILDQLKEMGDDAEAKGRGVTISTALECNPIVVQVVPTGSIKEAHMKRLKWIENWEEKLRKCFETGNPGFFV